MPESLNTAEKIVAVMRFSEEPCLRKVLSAYDACPVGDRPSLPFEAFVLKADVSIPELIGGIIMAFKTTQAQKSAMSAMDSHPEVLKRTIKFAMERKGHHDRKLLHEAVGFSPTPRGTTFNVNLPTNAPAVVEDKRESIDVESEPIMTEIFPVITGKQQDWQTNKNRLLKQDN